MLMNTAYFSNQFVSRSTISTTHLFDVIFQLLSHNMGKVWHLELKHIRRRKTIITEFDMNSKSKTMFCLSWVPLNRWGHASIFPLKCVSHKLLSIVRPRCLLKEFSQTVNESWCVCKHSLISQFLQLKRKLQLFQEQNSKQLLVPAA